MTDLDLMQQVERLAGPYLDRFAPSSSIPEAFWAALTANESGGLISARRFEPGVYRHLIAVTGGESRAYGDIDRTSLEEKLALVRAATYHGQFLTGTWAASHRAELAALDDQTLRRLATSYGFTQVMGYHTIGWRTAISSLEDPAQHYPEAARLMADFCRQYMLDPSIDFEAMARCWNTGRPDGATYDPNYVPNLLDRMKLWESL